MKKYKLLATDIDGTLLDDNLSIAIGNIEAIKKCVDNGIHVVLISGRAPVSINMFLEQLNLKKDNVYAAGFHGGQVFSAKDMSVIHQYNIEKSLALEILDTVKKYDSLGILAYEGDILYTHNINEEVTDYCNRTHTIPNLINDFKEIKGVISKILVRGSDETLLEVEKKCKKFENKCKVMLTGYRLLEFANYTGNKGDALKHICQLLNVDIEECVSVGDNYNDIELIETAGVGVATYNAVDVLKELADYITKKDNNKGAVAEVVEKYFF